MAQDLPGVEPKEKFKGFGIPYYKRKYYKFD